MSAPSATSAAASSGLAWAGLGSAAERPIENAFRLPLKPRARDDLEVDEREGEGGSPVFLIKDRATGRFARLGALHFTVLEIVEHGEVAVQAIPGILQRDHDVRLSISDVLRVLADLDAHHLLELTPAQLQNAKVRARVVQKALAKEPLPAAARAALQRRDWPRLLAVLLEARAAEPEPGPAAELFTAVQAVLVRELARDVSMGSRLRRWRFRLFDPTRLLDAVVPVARRLAHPATAVVAVLGLLVAAGLQVGSWDRMKLEVAGFLAAPALHLVLGTMLFTMFVHELSHGLACRLFGGEVREVGVMLVYMSIPAAYCDVSDAYRFTSRRQRIWVGVAGCMANVVMWIIATILWRVLSPDLWLTRCCLVIMASTGVGLLFNMNPLLPLDGYFVLCDALEMENLRARATTYLWRWLGAKLRGEAPPQVSARERKVYLIYGALALAYTVLIIVGLVTLVFTRLVGTFRGFGLVLFAVAIYLLFGGLIGSVWQRLKRRRYTRVELVAYGALLAFLGWVVLAWI